MLNTNSTDTMDEFILTKDFIYYKTQIQVKVNLYSDCIRIFKYKHKNKQTIELDKLVLFNDLVGCSIGKGPKAQDTRAYLTLYTYPKINSSKSQKRQRVVIELALNEHAKFEDNLEVLKEWSNEISKCLSREDSSNEKPFLVFVNPNSGSGKASNLFKERILPVWSEANIPFKFVQTEYANFAREKIKMTNLAQYKGILIVSGDGLIFEVINGLMDRDDWQSAIHTPVGQLPGGSGNALACCVSYLAREQYANLNLESFVMHSAFLTAKHNILPLDLIGIHLSTTNESYSKLKDPYFIYSFLSLEWALIADIDSESENYRFLGGLRFTVGAIKRVLKLRIYPGRLSFLPVGEFKLKDNRIKLLQNVQPSSSTSPSFDTCKTKFKYLKPFNEILPLDWFTIEDNFIFVLIVNLPLIAKDFNASPNSKFDDAQLLLIFIREGITKIELLKLFGDTETGAYLNSPKVECIPIKAFRIEPLTDQGCFMIDGERVPYGPIQGEVLPSMANVIAKRIESM
jgi:sphingosine kinase